MHTLACALQVMVLWPWKILASMVWRIADGPAAFRRDLTASIMIAVYVPFLLGFGILLFESDDGQLRVLATVLAVVLSDTGGYAAGVFLGKHKMAPAIKRSLASMSRATSSGCEMSMKSRALSCSAV